VKEIPYGQNLLDHCRRAPVTILFVVPSGEEGSAEESSVYYADYYLVELKSGKDAEPVRELFRRYGRDTCQLLEQLRQCSLIAAFQVLTKAAEIV
jgi:hypothetical protein